MCRGGSPLRVSGTERSPAVDRLHQRAHPGVAVILIAPVIAHNVLLLVLLLLLRAPFAVIALAITAITENVRVRISVIAVIADLAITRAITVTSAATSCRSICWQNFASSTVGHHARWRAEHSMAC